MPDFRQDVDISRFHVGYSLFLNFITNALTCQCLLEITVILVYNNGKVCEFPYSATYNSIFAHSLHIRKNQNINSNLSLVLIFLLSDGTDLQLRFYYKFPLCSKCTVRQYFGQTFKRLTGVDY